MTDIELVLRKLATLQDHLQRARRRRPETIEVLTADQDLQDALSMSLLVAIPALNPRVARGSGACCSKGRGSEAGRCWRAASACDSLKGAPHSECCQPIEGANSPRRRGSNNAL
jgi:hypothetical protein